MVKCQQTIWLFLLLYSGASFAQTYLINLPYPLKGTSEGQNVQHFFTNVYNELNISPSFVYSSVTRSFRLMESGKLNAEAYRTSHVGDPLGKAFKIDLPLTQVKVGLFCGSRERCKTSEEGVYALQQDFGYGLHVCARLRLNCKTVSNTISLTKLLEAGYIDAVISPYPAYREYLCRANSSQFYYHELEGAALDVFHFNASNDKVFRAKLKQSLEKWLNIDRDTFKAYVGAPNLSLCAKTLLPAMSEI